jgi:hypothetical protein
LISASATVDALPLVPTGGFFVEGEIMFELDDSFHVYDTTLR